MDDLGERLARAREQLQPRWDATRAAAVADRLEEKRHVVPRPRRARVLALAGLMACSVVTALLVSRTRAPRPVMERPSVVVAAASASDARPQDEPDRPAPPSPAAVPGEVPLGDGSLAVLLDDATEIEILADTPDRVTIEQRSGHCRFEVAHLSSRRFEVLAGEVRVVALGTSFTVTLAQDGVEVLVHRGRVRIERAGRARELGAGERAWFSSSPPQPVAEEPDDPALPRTPQTAAPDWRQDARQGRFHEAWAGLHSLDERDAPRAPEDLLLAADAARFSGREVEAIAYLARLHGAHPDHPDAPLAAFTAGRIHLTHASPREAARSFARSRLLAPSGPLAADALSREAEAWQVAGEQRLARRRAAEYVETYPDGPRAAWMRSMVSGE